MDLITLANVSFTYPDGTQALTDINLSVQAGERVAVLGANGAGKSTLFQLFNGLLNPTGGKVTIKDRVIEKAYLKEVRRMIGMVFQDPDDQLFSSTVRQEIAYGLINLGLAGNKIEQAVAWALQVVGLPGYESKSPFNLSGGEKKRVALASVLAMKPEVLVLDEPTAALDPRGVAQLVELLNDINRSLHITLVFATHDVDVVPLLADRIYVMNRGRINIFGPTAEVFSQKKAIRDNNLRLPRVAHLVELLQRDGFAQPDHRREATGTNKGWDAAEPAALPMTIGQARRMLEHWPKQ